MAPKAAHRPAEKYQIYKRTKKNSLHAMQALRYLLAAQCATEYSLQRSAREALLFYERFISHFCTRGGASSSGPARAYLDN